MGCEAAAWTAGLFCPKTMSVTLLWLGFTLLGALHTQAQSSTPRLLRAPPLSKIPLQPNFQADQFQGKWYVVGVAGNAIKKEEQDQFKMYTSNYELKEDGSYNVTSTLLRDEGCDYWIRTFVPSSRPGQFTLGNIKSYPGIRSYTVRVVNTDYNQFAIVFFKKVQKKQGYFKTILYGRTKELTPEVKENFINFAKSLRLTDDHIVFTVPIDRCIDDQ
ncbi:neutrophil gelatinase-associated lipocalin isoform X2 [Cervus elaphus]|nr:neutrophil gelatinase-associated lipocalin isoform X2 [Cervus elaphus]